MWLSRNKEHKDTQDQGAAELQAIRQSMAMIEFDPTGVILDANENFCKTMGYSADEVRGKHHRVFCEEAFYRSEEYARLWRDLARGEPISGTFLRLNKAGREVWLEASYMPVYGPDKQVRSVIKVAADITARINKEHEEESMLAAIGRSMAVIEFNLEGEVVSANQNFLDTVGYDISEIAGRHHQIFCDGDYASSAEYRDFWRELGQGRFVSDQFTRVGHGGTKIHKQASNNPLKDSRITCQPDHKILMATSPAIRGSSIAHPETIAISTPNVTPTEEITSDSRWCPSATKAGERRLRPCEISVQHQIALITLAASAPGRPSSAIKVCTRSALRPVGPTSASATASASLRAGIRNGRRCCTRPADRCSNG